MAVIVYDPKLHGDDDVRRNRVREWLETNGLDTRHVSVNGVIRVEGSHVHFLGNVLGEDGERCVSQDPEIAGAPVLAGMSARLKVEWTEEEDNG